MKLHLKEGLLASAKLSGERTVLVPILEDLVRRYESDLARNIQPIERAMGLLENERAGRLSLEDREEILRLVVEYLINWQTRGSVAIEASHKMKRLGFLRDAESLRDVPKVHSALQGVRFSAAKAAMIAKAANEIQTRANGSISNWLDMVSTGKLMIGKGSPKVRANMLKQFGYLDEIPIDTHVIRFFKRVANLELSPSHSERLKLFCRRELSGVKFRGFDLGLQPGILDKLIRIHCSPDNDEFGRPYHNICGIIARCGECTVREICPKYGVS